jgi:hypothetical protein
MNYPVWELESIGGGTLVAIIAIAHVLISHFAVGGGLFLVLTEMKARRNNDLAMLAYVRSHTRFFLLLTMVFGGLSGVGIWFIIALVSPAATSTLIHSFVFGWATEWVFFIGEIIALLIYHYRFDKMTARNHIIVGWLYFIFAWLSLFIINGILGFMLTPGNWVETFSFWDGFFNPSFMPALIFRTGIALFIAGLFGLVTAVYNKDHALRKRFFRYNIQWLFLPFIIVAIGGFWYLGIVPETSLENLFKYNAQTIKFINLLLISTVLIFAFGILFLLKLPLFMHKVSVYLLILVGLGWMAGFEYMREIARKPYVLNEVMYSNSVFREDVAMFNDEGYLYHAKWAQVSELEENFLAAGKELFKLQCLSCHTIDGYNSILNVTGHLTQRGLEAQLTGQGHINTYMPPFMGTEKEKRALASYIYQELHGKTPAVNEEVTVEGSLPELPPFNIKNDEYLILAWNDLGMHCISDNDKYFSFLPPANTLWAQVIKRGPIPEIVTANIEMSFEVEDGFKYPEKHVNFWEYSKIVYGADLPPGQGLTGNRVDGNFHENSSVGVFIAEFIPVVPYKDDGSYNPYPVFTLTAKDKESGETLAVTKVVAPTSTEMGCRNCHGGGWKVNNFSGVSDETAMNILKAHDLRSNTNLLEDALNGEPALCQSCHADPAVGAPGKADVINFSAAIHGFHANYLRGLDHESCMLCHPARPTGNTSCSRGRHNSINVSCINCHGTMEDHGLALVKHELGKTEAPRLVANLEGRYVREIDQVNPRMPWLMQPDCKNCHTGFDIKGQESVPASFNNWVPGFSVLYRNRTDNHGVMCAACHGSPHAVYPAVNKYSADLDNLQALQYMGIAGTIGTSGNCKVCHIVEMNFNAHHKNMIRKSRKNTGAELLAEE